MKPEPSLDALGIPSPPKKDHQPYIDLITIALDWAHKHKNAPPYITNPEADLIIYTSFLISETAWWITRFRDSQNKARLFYHDPNTYWKAIAIGVSHPKVLDICKKLLPSLDPENYPTKTSTTPSPQRVRTQPTSTPSIGATLKKVISKIPKRRWPTPTEYILFHAPSKSYERTYSTTLSRCKNKRSSKGKKVYPYGQAYIARLTGLNLRTIELHWSWLRKQGIFNKARNENPELHHCALWYVCTSMKQIPYFRDPKNLHRKSKRQD
jgi:hypothetical protein